MQSVISADGTRIAYETLGSGPPLILIDGAMCFRDFGPMRDLAAVLTDSFTVIIFDRRGRGESGNTLPYAPEREIEDVVALIDGPGGGSAYLYGCSSGGAIALATANAAPDKVRKVMSYEMPVIVDDLRKPITGDYIAEIAANVAAGRNGVAAKMFMRAVGAPRLAVAFMPLMMGRKWKTLEGVAATLPHDFAFVGPYQQGKPLPPEHWQDITAPVLIADGGKSPQWMRNGQAALARVLGAETVTLPGQTHMVKPEPQVPVIKRFLLGD